MSHRAVFEVDADGITPARSVMSLFLLLAGDCPALPRDPRADRAGHERHAGHFDRGFWKAQVSQRRSPAIG